MGRAGSMLERPGSMVEHAGGFVERAGSMVERAGSMLERAGSMVGACWSVLGACPREKKAVVWTLGSARATEFAQITFFFLMVWCMTMPKKIKNKKFDARARTRIGN